MAILLSSFQIQSFAAQYSGNELQFPGTLSSAMPYDVDRSVLNHYLDRNDIPAAQRLFDIFSWKMFVSLNWPADKNGQADPAKNLSDLQLPLRWEFFRGADSIFLPDGATPKPWGGSKGWLGAEKMLEEGKPPVRDLWMTRKADPGRDHQVLDESFQAFSGPLVDQNGKWVRYEVLVNRTEFDYLFRNQLYSIDGQVAFSKDHQVDFPANEGNRHGSIEIKLSWKQLGADDDATRFLVRKAYVQHVIADRHGNIVKTKPTLETMGLVGMHIAVRTESSPTWIWATFEQIDNVNANDLEKDARGRPLHPNFFNPAAPTRLVNTLPPMNAVPDANGHFTSWAENRTTDPTQVLQVLPVPAATEALNDMVRAQLKGQGSVLQYYRLIGTQWPVHPGFPAFAGGTSVTGGTSTPESILYKIPGKVVPVYLVNTTMETYFQKGNQVAGPLEEDDRLPRGEVSDKAMVFGTESCNGCHFSAGVAVGFKTDANGREIVDSDGFRIPVYGKNGNFGQTGGGNFSWLLQLRAQSRPVKPH